MKSECASSTIEQNADVKPAEAKTGSFPKPTNACTTKKWNTIDRNVNMRWKFTKTVPQPRCSWNVFENTEANRWFLSVAVCAVRQKCLNRAYAPVTCSCWSGVAAVGRLNLLNE